MIPDTAPEAAVFSEGILPVKIGKSLFPLKV
jgi:hypothetical protein